MQAQLLTRIESGGFINSSLLLNALEALRDQERINFSFYKPYPIFEEFHRLGIEAMIRLLLAANRIGKTFSALAETAMHSTLTYPKDWKGYKYKKKKYDHLDWRFKRL